MVGGLSAEGAYSHEVGPLDLTAALVLLSNFTLKKKKKPIQDRDLNSTTSNPIPEYPHLLHRR